MAICRKCGSATQHFKAEICAECLWVIEGKFSLVAPERLVISVLSTLEDQKRFIESGKKFAARTARYGGYRVL